MKGPRSMLDRYTMAILAELLAVDGACERELRTCASHAQSDALRALFNSQARWYATAAAELLDLVGAGVNGHAAAFTTIRRTRLGWTNLLAALSRKDDEALVEECERGQDLALETYRNALDDHLPEHVREVVLRQFETVMSEQPLYRVAARDSWLAVSPP